MPKITWLGDDDASQQIIEQFGYTFIKGEPTDVPDKDKNIQAFTDNAYFSVGKKADAIESTVGDPPNPEDGTEIGALKAELDGRGVKYAANASVETLRGLLAKDAK